MKRRMKRWRMAAVFFVFFVLLPVSVPGAGTAALFERCEAGRDELRILCSGPDGADFTAKTDSFRLTLAGEEIPVVSAVPIREAGIPVTVYCLVDVSGSMGSSQMEQVKETLAAVCDSLADGDNMVIATLGNQTETSGFLSGKDEIMEVVETLSAGKEDTNLYAGIVESLRVLRTDREVHTKRCLLILSDGEDDQKSGITREEAEREVTGSRIPVFTVATLPQQPDESAIGYGKLLGSFARLSVGGAHYTPSLDEITGEEAGIAIAARIDESLLLTAEVSGLPEGRDALLLRMMYTAPDGSSYEDTAELYAEDFSAADGMEEVSSTEDFSATESSSVGEEKGQKTGMPNLPLLIFAAVAVPVVSAVVIFVVIRRKKGAEGAAAGEDSGNIDEASGFEETESLTVTDSGLQQNISGGKNGANVKKLVLTAVGYEDISYTIPLPEGIEVTVGRDKRAAVILDKGDKKLSGVHCMMKRERDKVYIVDLKSTNGTFVNGIPIQGIGRAAVREGETIRIGSYEYRVGWK